MQGFSKTPGNTFHYLEFNEESLLPTLPPQIYTLGFSKMEGFFFEATSPSFTIPKVYGPAKARAERILRAFSSREKNTGVLLTGNKGSGKTLFSKFVANEAIKAGLPIILINQAFTGDAFEAAIESVGTCVLVFDEMAKRYGKASSPDEDSENSSKGQQALLSFTDGLSSATKRLLLFTENNEYDVDDLFINRPGRILFHYKFGKLSESEISEYLQDAGYDPDSIVAVIEYSRYAREFSYDMLSAIVEEWKRNPDCTLDELTADINIKHPNKQDNDYEYLVDFVTYDDIPAYVQDANRPVEHGKSVLVFLDPKNPTVSDLETIRNSSTGIRTWIELSAYTLYYETMTEAVFKNDRFQISARKVPKKKPSPL